MASLQQTFKYEGNITVAPFKTVNLNFEIPVFEFITSFIENKPFIERNKIDIQSISIFQSLVKSKYALNIPNELLIGDTEISCLNFWKYLSQIGFSNKSTGILSSISIGYSVQISDDHENLFGTLTQNAIYSIATSSDKYWKLIDRLKVNRGREILDEDVEKNIELELSDYVKENIILLNKGVFKKVAAEFKSLVPALNEYAFLYLVSHLTDLSNGKPVFEIDAEEIKVFLKTHFDIDKAAIVKSIIRLAKENFDRLFDFPITVPEIKTVEIKGTFKIVTSDNTSVGLSDFNFYDLAVEYSTSVNENESQPVSINFNWGTITTTELNNNTLSFSFAPVITNALDSHIQVRVKGYDGSLLWEDEFAVTNTDLQHLKIEVPLLKPLVVNSSGRSQPVAGNKKLQGKLVEITGKCELKGATVLVQTKKANDTIWKVVGVATTDGSGNFSMPYPYGIYTAAQALVSLSPNSPADITIHSEQGNVLLNETIADDFLYLLLKDVVCEDKSKEEDCDCHEPKKSNRLPDQEQLISSDDYTQDIGGSCINLSTPNRTLNEYSHKAVVRTSDPDVANYTLVKNENGAFHLKGGHRKITRKKVNLNNIIRWQDAPDNKDNLSFYQAVTVATGHILHYKVAMKADGYSMGELLYSLPLAPGQKKQIVMFDQTHTLRGAETQRISQRENLAASLVNEIDITDTLGGSINENTRGSSSANTSGVSGGLGLAGIIQGIAGTIGIAGGIANANSSSSQNSSRTVAQHFQEQMRNGITQNAQSYREQNASVITTVREGQEYGVTAEVVANHNHCHSLTMMYFEVLRHYAIYQELSQVEECLFVPLLMTEFSKENIYKWRDVLAKHLLPMPAETYLQPFTVVKSGRQHPLLRAFDAIERRKTDYKHVDFPEGAYDDEIINFVTGEMYIQTNLPRPKTAFDRIQSWPVIEKEEGSNWSWTGAIAGAILRGPIGALAGGIIAAEGITITMEVQKIINEYITIDANYRSLPPAKAIRVIKFDDYFFEDGGNDKNQWLAYAKLLGKSLTDMLEYYFKDRLIAEWDNIFYNDIAPVLFQKIVEKIKIGTFSALDFSSERKYKGGNTLMRINLRGIGSNKKRKEIESLKIELNTISNVNNILFGIIIPNLHHLTNDLITLNVSRLTIRYSTSHYNGILFSGSLGNDDLIDGTEIFTPENADEKRDPRKEDKYLALKLIEHLNSNLEYYNKKLWRDLDPDRRYMLLDGFRIETYNNFGDSAGFRSLASVIKNELIGISGNSLIMPVAPGYKIDRSLIVEQPIEGPAEEINLFERYKPLTPAPPYRISVPSKGVFAEAVQGACDACEKVKENTSQDWDKFKTDEPTAINPVTTPVPVVTDWKAAFKDFATPIVNIQNAPAAPAPGAGLAGLSDLLGKNDVFRDVTGLDANQKNAMQTYLSNQQNAKEFAQMAKDIYTMDSNNKNADAIADSIRNSPELSDEKKAELLEKQINQRIDGGQSDKVAKEAAGKNNEPTAMGIASAAESKGKPVKVGTLDAEGNSQTLEVGTSSSVSPLPTSTPINPFIKNNMRDISPDMRCFYPSISSKSLYLQIMLHNFSFSANRISKIRFVAGPNNIQDITSRNVPQMGYLLKHSPDIAAHKMVILDLFGITPGVYDLVLEEFDNTTPTKLLDSEKLSFSVPQCFCIRENTNIYESVTRVGTIDNPHLFDSVLRELDLLDVKQDIITEMRDIAELLLQDFNVRLFWQIGQFDEDLPRFSEKYKENTGIDINEKFQTMTLSTISIGGMPKSITSNSDGTYAGYTQGYNDTIQKLTEYNRPIFIFPGVWINILDNSFVSNSPIVATARQLLTAYKSAGAAYLSNPDDEAIKNEYIRMKTICMRVIARATGFVIAHEIAHVLAGSGAGHPLDSDGHHQPFPDFKGRGLLSGMHDIDHVTGISISNPEAFPDKDTYSWTNSDNLIRNYNLDDDPELVKFIQEKVPIPPTPPFDK